MTADDDFFWRALLQLGADAQATPVPSGSVSAVPPSLVDRPHEGDISPVEYGGPSLTSITSKRSLTGCLTCRRRKVKCDERSDVCQKCAIGKRECVWPAGGKSIPRRRPRDAEEASEIFMGELQPSGVSPTAVKLRVIPQRPPPAKYAKIPICMRLVLMKDPTFLEPYFPPMDQRLIIRHYFTHTTKAMLAYSSDRQPWNPWLALHAPLAFTHTPGQSRAADALRAGMLAVGTIHLHFLQPYKDPHLLTFVAREAKMSVISLVKQGLDAKNDGSEGEVDENNVLTQLSALLSCLIACSLVGDSSWLDILHTAFDLIRSVGGPEAVLGFGSSLYFTPHRFCLEQLAFRDVMGCLTMARAPQLLDTPFTPWFFTMEEYSAIEGDWGTVDRMLGMSRGMIDIIARTASIVSKVLETGHKVKNLDRVPPEEEARGTPEPEFELRLPTKRRKLGSPARRVSFAFQRMEIDSPEVKADRMELETSANDLMAGMKIWSEATNFIPQHPRVQYGNLAFRHAMRIHMLRSVFGTASDDAEVMSAARAILEMAVELVCWFGQLCWFTWPILVAGVHIPDGDIGRETVVNLLGQNGPHACYGGVYAEQVVQRYWKRAAGDEEEGKVWAAFVRDMGAFPFSD